MNERQRRRAVVFDLDGTLLDSLPLVLAAIRHAVEPFGGEPTMELFARLGGPPERFLLELIGEERHLPTALERLEGFHRGNAHLIQPFDGMRELLDVLRASGLKTAVWTGRDRTSAEWLLRRHDVEHRFDTMVCGDDLPTHKPDPAGLREIVQRLGVSPPEVLFVGDADVDVLGGVACGVDTLLIRHGRSIAPAIAGQCWRMVVSPAEAYGIVRGIMGPAA